MNEKQTAAPESIRPTKKQRDLLSYIETFIAEHGYSPSYREIMNGLNYTSVATVALHVNSLIKRGHLRKRDRNARSLEVVTTTTEPAKITSNLVTDSQEKWLVEKIEHQFSQAEQAGGQLVKGSVEDLYTLVHALQVLGMDGAVQSFLPRLNELKQSLAAE